MIQKVRGFDAKAFYTFCSRSKGKRMNSSGSNDMVLSSLLDKTDALIVIEDLESKIFDLDFLLLW